MGTDREGRRGQAPMSPKDAQLIPQSQFDKHLAEAHTPAETKAIADQLNHLIGLAKTLGATTQEINRLIFTKRVPALRQLGRQLEDVPRDNGGRPPKTRQHVLTSLQDTLAKLGISRDTAMRYIRFANTDERELETFCQPFIESPDIVLELTWTTLWRWVMGKPVSTSGMRRQPAFCNVVNTAVAVFSKAITSIWSTESKRLYSPIPSSS